MNMYFYIYIYSKHRWITEFLARLTYLQSGQVQAALNQLLVIPLNQAALLQLTAFDSSISSCYDPNEELRLRHVIDAIGTKLFESKIRQLGQLILDRELTKSKGMLVDAMCVDEYDAVDNPTSPQSDAISEGSYVEI